MKNDFEIPDKYEVAINGFEIDDDKFSYVK